MAQLQLDFEWMLLGLGLVVLVAFGVFVIVRFRRWQADQQSSQPAPHVEDYRVLMEQGLLDPSEFERIRDRLEGRSGQESGDRNQETGIRSQETGVRKQETGVRNQETEVRKQDSSQEQRSDP
jgi:hypothetical protein